MLPSRVFRANRTTFGDSKMSDQWYYAQGQNRVGPMPLAQLIQQLPSVGGPNALVYGPGFANWLPAAQVPQIAQAMGGGAMARPNAMPPIPASAGGRRSHEIDYEVFGNEMQYVVITLDGGETVIAEPGGFMYMDMGIEMKTVFGDPNKEKSGFFDKLKTAGK